MQFGLSGFGQPSWKFIEGEFNSISIITSSWEPCLWVLPQTLPLSSPCLVDFYTCRPRCYSWGKPSLISWGQNGWNACFLLALQSSLILSIYSSSLCLCSFPPKLHCVHHHLSKCLAPCSCPQATDWVNRHLLCGGHCGHWALCQAQGQWEWVTLDLKWLPIGELSKMHMYL